MVSREVVVKERDADMATFSALPLALAHFGRPPTPQSH